MTSAIEAVGPGAAELLAELHRRSVPRPWSARDFDELLVLPGTTALVAATAAPVGFILLRQVADEAEVLMVAVEPAARRQGIAGSLLQAAVGVLHGVTQLFLEVAADNHPAIALYTAAGFAEIGVRRGYYTGIDGARTDAIVMRLAPALSCREPV